MVFLCGKSVFLVKQCQLFMEFLKEKMIKSFECTEKRIKWITLQLYAEVKMRHRVVIGLLGILDSSSACLGQL